MLDNDTKHLLYEQLRTSARPRVNPLQKVQAKRSLTTHKLCQRCRSILLGARIKHFCPQTSCKSCHLLVNNLSTKRCTCYFSGQCGNKRPSNQIKLICKSTDMQIVASHAHIVVGPDPKKAQPHPDHERCDLNAHRPF